MTNNQLFITIIIILISFFAGYKYSEAEAVRAAKRIKRYKSL